MVGYLMIRIVADIDWTQPENAIPAFLTIAGIPLTFSIAAGIGLGVISYVLVMAATGKARDVHPLMWGDRAVLRGLLRGRLAERARVLAKAVATREVIGGGRRDPGCAGGPGETLERPGRVARRRESAGA